MSVNTAIVKSAPRVGEIPLIIDAAACASGRVPLIG